GTEARGDVFAERDRRGAREADAVVVVQNDQLAEAEMAGERACLGGYPLLDVSITRQHEGVMVDDLVAGSVEACRQDRLGNRRSRMALVGLMHRVDGQEADRVDGQLVELYCWHGNRSQATRVRTFTVSPSCTSTRSAMPTKSPVSTTPGISRIWRSSAAGSSI